MKKRSRGKLAPVNDGRNLKIILVVAMLLIGSAIAVYNADSLYLAGEKSLTSQLPATVSPNATNTLMLLTTDGNGEPAANEDFTITLVQGNDTLVEVTGKTDSNGFAAPMVMVPEFEGEAELRIETSDQFLTRSVEATATSHIFLTTDKPIYQPGQTVHARVLVIRGDQVVEGSKATFEVKTPEGDLVLRKDSRLNGFGVTSFDYLLSDQLPLGDYEMKVIVDGQEAVRVVKVDEYVLPRFQIDVGDMKAWYTGSEDIDGYILAKYFFGQRVIGTAGLDVNLFTGDEWVNIASNQTVPLVDGVYEFYMESYMLGMSIEEEFGYESPDSVLLEFNFTVKDTGDHVEHESYIVTYAKQAIVVTALADANVEGQTSTYYAVARFPDGSMAGGAEIKYWIDDDEKGSKTVTTDDRGIAQIKFTYSEDKDYLHLRVSKDGYIGETDLALEESGGLKVVPDRTTYEVGDVAHLSIFYGGDGATDLVYYDVVADGFTIITGHLSMKGDRTTLDVPVTSDFGQVTSVRVYKVERNFNIARDVAVIGVSKQGDLDIDITPGKDTYLPQEDVTIQVKVTRDGNGVASVLGVSIVDNAVFELGGRYTGFEEVLAGLLPQYSDPIYQFMGYIFVGDTPMPAETLSEWRKIEAAPVETTAKAQGEDAAALQDRAVVAYWTVLAALGIVALVAMAALGPKTKKARVTAVVVMLLVVAFGAAVVTMVNNPEDDDFGDFANDADFFGGRNADMAMEDEGAMGGWDGGLPKDGGGEVPPPAPGGGGYTVPAKPSIVRQFFPETWAWIPILPTDDSGQATIDLVAPDSITSWDVSVIASTKDALVGVGHEDVTVFQEFFIEPDLPAKAFLGDTFPLKVQVYNYGDPTDVEVTLDQADWFNIVGEDFAVTSLTTGEVGHVEFTIELTEVGVGEITVTGESASFIDTVIKPLRVKPVGDKITVLEQGRLSPGDDLTYDLEMLDELIENSENAWVKLQGGVEAAVIEGAENYIHYVSGCGEQSLSTLSIDVLAFRTVREGDLDEAKLLELEMITNQGIIHELQYLMDAKNGKGRGIVWFPGDQDVHPWLTSWGLITFEDARRAGFTVDDAIIEDMQEWLLSQQKGDGSFEFPEWGLYEFNNPKLQQKTVATTAYITHSLLSSGIPATDPAIVKAISYIKDNIEDEKYADDPYVLALGLKVLATAGEARSDLAGRLADAIHEQRVEENGTVFWGSETNMISNDVFEGAFEPWDMWDRNPGFVIETTGYAAQALHLAGKHTGDVDGAIKFLLDHRSSLGGYFSTQDTVVAFQTIYEVSTMQSPVDMDVEILVDGEVIWTQTMDDDNRDLTYLFDLRPLLAEDVTSVRLRGTGEGFVMFQVYLEQWVPFDETPVYHPLELAIDYKFVGYDINMDDGIDVDALVGESIPVVARVTNHEDSPVKMALVELMAPVGMTFDHDDFEHMRDEGKVDNVEYEDDVVRLYINDIEKGEDVHFSFNLIAEEEAQVTIAGVRVFDMYNALHEMFLAPLEVSIGNI